MQPPSTGQTLKDLRAVVGPSLAGILVPKVQGPADIHMADALLGCTEVDFGLPKSSLVIYPILETAQALRLAYEVAMASPRVAYMGGALSRFGDIHQALGYRWTPEGEETLFFRSKVLVDARAAGIRYPISGMWGGGRDDFDGLREWATKLRNLGYYGMMLGDPAHIPIVHEVFTPTADELAVLAGARSPRHRRRAHRRGPDPLRRSQPRRGARGAHRARGFRPQEPRVGGRSRRARRELIASGLPRSKVAGPPDRVPATHGGRRGPVAALLRRRGARLDPDPAGPGLRVPRCQRAQGSQHLDARTCAALVIPPAWNDVWICTDADGHLQATGRDARGRKQYRYHDEWREFRDRVKFDRLVLFGRALPTSDGR